MSEMTWTEVRIGGSVPENRLAELTERIDEAFGGNRDLPEMDSDGEWIREAAKEGKALYLSGEINYGKPEGLIAFCVEYDLTYWIHFDAGFEWSSGIEYWKPGDDEPTEDRDCEANSQTGEPTVTLQELHTAQQNGQTLADVIANTSAFEAERVPPLTIGPSVIDDDVEPTGAVMPDGTKVDQWDERLRAAGATPNVRNDTELTDLRVDEIDEYAKEHDR